MNEHYPFVNPPLPYDYDALEPFIDTKTMMIHHDRHLQTYVNNLNQALKQYPKLQGMSLDELLQNTDDFPKDVQKPIKNNGGGVYNHIFYFNGMSNSKNRSHAGSLYSAILQEFGSPEQFYEEFKKKALDVFGSGYAWLVVTPDDNLSIITSANQDTPITKNLCPILTIDVWEHAYYLKHYNQRADYINDWFHVINWEHAAKLYQACLS